MYTEEYDKRPFPFRDFLLKFIIIVIFALFLIWIIPKFISPKTASKESTSSKVFEKNLTAMKNASISYYSKKANLPTDNSKEVITLRQMINKKMITAFTDKNGKACDVDKSYSEITSSNNEYVLKVKLKCSNEEDYVLTKLGSYSYCTTEICEKDISKTDSSSLTTNDGNNTSSIDNGESKSSSDDSNKEEVVSDNISSAVNYTYEYQKTIGNVLSEWGEWSEFTKNTNRYAVVTCNQNDTSCLKEIELTSKRERVGTTPSGDKMMATVSYYRTRTRSYTPETTDTKWSAYNDQALLEKGYKMTGNKKETD